MNYFKKQQMALVPPLFLIVITANELCCDENRGIATKKNLDQLAIEFFSSNR